MTLMTVDSKDTTEAVRQIVEPVEQMRQIKFSKASTSTSEQGVSLTVSPGRFRDDKLRNAPPTAFAKFRQFYLLDQRELTIIYFHL